MIIAKTNKCEPIPRVWDTPPHYVDTHSHRYANGELKYLVTVVSRGLYIYWVNSNMSFLGDINDDMIEDLAYNVVKWSLANKICKQLSGGQPCVRRTEWRSFEVNGLNEHIWDVRYDVSNGLMLIKGIDPWYKEPCRGCGADTDGGHFCNSCKQEARSKLNFPIK